MAKELVFDGSDVADAIKKACSDLNVSQDKLDIEIVRTGASGIFGLIRRKARVKVALKEASAKPEEQEVAVAPKVADREPKRQARPAKKDGPRERRPRQESEPPAAMTDELFAIVEEDTGRMLDLMGFPSKVTVSQEENKVMVHIAGDHDERIVGSEGQTLDALQYLLRKMVSRKVPGRVMITMDVGDFRARRKEELIELARQLADEVRETGKTRMLPSLNPAERRIVHVCLQQDNTIRSRSVGDGIFKKVLIYLPSKGRKRGPRRRKNGSSAAAVQE